MYSQDRVQLRKVYNEAWRKAQMLEILSPLESLMAELIHLHPEYQSYFEQDQHIDKDFTVEAGVTNPFLHISLHMAIREQIGMDQPPGIRDIYEKICHTIHEPHEAEHILMDHLAELIWGTSRGQAAPDDAAYLQSLRAHLATQGLG
jgi:hypothetical protein